MVIIEQQKDRLRIACTKCNQGYMMTTNMEWSDIDALMHLCPHCFGDLLVEIVRNHQRAEGNPDCFAKSESFCDQHLCKFRQVCLKMERRS